MTQSIQSSVSLSAGNNSEQAFTLMQKLITLSSEGKFDIIDSLIDRIRTLTSKSVIPQEEEMKGENSFQLVDKAKETEEKKTTFEIISDDSQLSEVDCLKELEDN